MVQTAGRGIESCKPLFHVLELVDTDREVQFAQALRKALKFVDLFGLGLVQFYGTAHAAQVVFHTFHIHLHAFKLPAGFLTLLLVLAHAGGFFEQHAAVVGLVRKNRLDHVGVHLRISAGTEARVKKQGMHVAKAAFLVVNQVFARTVTVHAAGHNHFGIFGIERSIAVINHNGNFGKAHGGTFFGSAKNHVLHLAHTERCCLLFAQNPADSVGNVRLAAPVRPHHGGETLRREVDFGPLSEGLKSKNL